MKSIVVFASHTGNTEHIAEAIVETLRKRGEAHTVPVETAPNDVLAGADLVVIGGPTEGHSMTKQVDEFLDHLETAALKNVAAAAFDTRIHLPRWLTGSAADGIADRLREAGADLIAPPESFFVSMKPELRPGEAERAADWAAGLADAVERREKAA